MPGDIITDKDPMLKLGNDKLYRPDSKSPLINAGENNYTVLMLDMDGQLRDSQPDIGADEVSSDAVIHKPVTPADVGLGNPDAFMSLIKR